MDPRTQFLLQLLQKLGAPLMGSVSAHSGADASPEKDAAIMASLLSESVKVGITLSQAMNLRPDDGNADAIRVSLAALAGGVIADQYRQTGRLPGDNDSRRLSKALESVIVFADNFAPAAEHAQRLQTLEQAPPFFDAVQTNLYAIHALVPVIAAVEEFSFGQQDTRLIQEIFDRLSARAKALVSGFGTAGNTMSELVTMQALGQIYANAHRAETARLKSQNRDGEASIDPVWTAFDRQVSMVEVLLRAMTGAPASASAGGSGGVKPAAEAPAQAQEQAAPPPPPPPPPAPPPAAEPPPAAPPAGGNPMAFFKKK